MTYSQLTIHQKINVKGNALTYYPASYNRALTLLMNKIRFRDPDGFTPQRLAIQTGKGYAI